MKRERRLREGSHSGCKQRHLILLLVFGEKFWNTNCVTQCFGTRGLGSGLVSQTISAKWVGTHGIHLYIELVLVEVWTAIMIIGIRE